MTWFSAPNSASLDRNQVTLKDKIFKAARWFWRFSNFYGEYNALPPSQRSKFVAEQAEAARKKSR